MDRIREAMGRDTLFTFLKTGRVGMQVRSFSEFWKRVETPVFRGYFIYELVKHILDCEKSKKVSGISVEMALATLSILVLGVQTDTGDEDYRRCIDEARIKWTQFTDGRETNKQTSEIVTNLISVALDNEREDYLNHIIIQSCGMFPSIRKFEDIAYIDFTGEVSKVQTCADVSKRWGLGSAELSVKPRFTQLECGVFAVNYLYVKQTFGQGMTLTPAYLEMYHSILNEICRNVKDGTSAAAEPTLLPLLHSLEELMRRFPINSNELMERLAAELDLVRRWPAPYGPAAQKVLEVLFYEYKCPGTALLHALRSDWPFIDIRLPLEEPPLDLMSSASAFIFLDSSEGTESCLFPALERLSKTLLFKQLNDAAWSAKRELPVNKVAFLAHALRIQVILFMHARNNALSPEDLSHIRGFDLTEIFEIYKKVTAMIDSVQHVETALATDMFRDSMTNMLNEMEAEPSDSSNPLTQVLLLFLSGNGNETYPPSLPPEQLLIIDSSGSGQRRESFNQALVRLFQRARDMSSPYFQRPIKVVLAGSDMVIHAFVSAYMSFLSTFSGDYNEIELRLFLVPQFGVKSTLCQYIGTFDSWYSRYVYVPFAKRPFAPRVDVNTEGKKLNKRSNLDISEDTSKVTVSIEDPEFEEAAPIKMMEGLLQDYLKDAKRPLNLRIYEVKCWRSTERVGRPDLTVPLSLYLELGITAAALRSKQSQEEFMNKSVAEIQESKHFHYEAPNLILRVRESNLLGKVSSRQEETAKDVRFLCISNVPRETDCWAEAIPSSEWLEFALLEERAALDDSVLRKKRAKGGKQKISVANQAINSLYTNLHVAEFSFGVSTRGLDSVGVDIIVDGELYGPFGAVEVAPWVLGEDKSQMLKVMTFLGPDM